MHILMVAAVAHVHRVPFKNVMSPGTTRGTFASVVLVGSGLSHLSGFHSFASFPQIRLLEFANSMER